MFFKYVISNGSNSLTKDVSSYRIFITFEILLGMQGYCLAIGSETGNLIFFPRLLESGKSVHRYLRT